MKVFVILLLMVFSGVQHAVAQEPYNFCNQALEICPNNTYTVNNIDANIAFCASCDDNFNFCFTNQNTIWFTFTTNAAGGNVQLDFSNLVFETNPGQGNQLETTVIQAGAPCDGTTYTQIGACISNGTGNFTLNAGVLPPNTTYYIVVDGSNTGVGITSAAEATFNIIISGTGINRPVSTVSILESSTNICLNDTVTFSATITDCPDNGIYEWYINGDLAATTVDTFFQTSAIQDGDIVSVKTTCYQICVDTVSVVTAPMNVYTVNVNAGPDFTINLDESLQLFGSTTAPVFYWSPSFLVSNTNLTNPIVSPTETTIFSFTAEENGCKLTDYTTVTVVTGLDVPNTFSPNEDGINDTWVIEGIENYPNNLIRIYSRWGQPVFQESRYTSENAWDGMINSGKASEGVYFYVIYLRNESDEILKGSITLIR